MDKDKSKDRDEGIPWCGDCGSYHSPKNPTCRKLWPKEYTLLAAGNGMYLAEELWHSPLDGRRGPMRQAWVWVAEDLLKALREKGIDIGGSWHAGGWQSIPGDAIPIDYRVACMWGMIDARGWWIDGTKKREGDPGIDWRAGLGLVRG